jgi:RNA polymerase sigma factor (sigma-70 family)
MNTSVLNRPSIEKGNDTRNVETGTGTNQVSKPELGLREIKSAADFRQLTPQQLDHLRRIVTRIVRRCFSNQVESCLDIVQDVSCKVLQWLDRGTFDPQRDDLTRVIGRITINHCNSLQRYQRAKGRDTVVEIGSCQLQLCAPAAAVDSTELMTAYINVVEKLPANQREIFRLHIFGAVEFATMAEQLKRSTDTIAATYRRACCKLAHYLRKFAPEGFIETDKQ